MVLVLALTILARAGTAAEASTQEWFESALTAIAVDDAHELDRCLVALGRDPSARIFAGTVQAVALEHQGKAKEGLQVLQAATGGIAQIGACPDEVHFIYLRLLGEGEDPDKAMALIDACCAASPSQSRQVWGMMTRARIHLHYQRLDQALAAAATAKEWAHRRSGSSSSDALDDYIMHTADALHRQIADAMDIMMHGAGFYLYAKGNAAYRAFAYDRAVAAYALLLDMWARNRGHPLVPVEGPDDPRFAQLPIYDLYAKAALVYQADAFYHLGKYTEALHAAAAAVADPGDPYHGEALLVTAEVQLASEGNLTGAIASLSDAIAWASNEARKEGLFARYGVPRRSLERTKPAPAMRHVDDWSNICWFAFEPQQVYNPNTCAWYADYLTYTCRCTRALCYALAGIPAKAVADLDVIEDIDPFDVQQTRNGMPSNYRRLKADFESGRLYATRAELELFPASLRYQVSLADLYLEIEQFDAANREYQRIGFMHRAQLSDPQQAYLAYAQAAALNFMGKPSEAVTLLRPFTGRWLKTITAPRALLLWADFQANPLDKAAVLDVAVKAASGTAFVRDILFRKAQVLYAGGFYADARSLFTQLMESARDPFAKTQCQNYLTQITHDMQAAKP